MPFRLVGVVPSEKAIGVWRWDSVQLTFQSHGMAYGALVFVELVGQMTPRACAELHAAMLSMNWMLAQHPGCADFTLRTLAVMDHSACASIVRT